MKRVLQEDENGCGMACVAMLTGRDYPTACRKFFGKRRGTYTDTKHLRHALGLAGISSGDRLVRLKVGETCALIKTDAILKVRPRNRKTGSWHWVVWDAKRRIALDPRKRPYKNPTVYSYLPVCRR